MQNMAQEMLFKNAKFLLFKNAKLSELDFYTETNPLQAKSEICITLSSVS